MGINGIILSGHKSIGVERWGGELNGSPLKTLTVVVVVCQRTWHDYSYTNRDSSLSVLAAEYFHPRTSETLTSLFQIDSPGVFPRVFQVSYSSF